MRHAAIYQKALDVLSRNTALVAGYPKPLLIEGSTYRGVWLECAPLEGLVYASIDSEAARENHMVFFSLEREDGQIPCAVKMGGIGFAQIQMVVPIAATAWELSQQTGDGELLEKAYAGCSRWDAWLRRYRDTRHTGLCEGFCTYDTGHDNSPRWNGIPNRCPDGDARRCPPIQSMPRLCPDLSATVYGGRMALAAMARALGRNSEADRWLADAALIRAAILDRLYSEEDRAFYDVDRQGGFVRIRGDLITRVLSEHVPDGKLFEQIYGRQIRSPQAFWAPYPLPSIALNDPGFVRPIPRNSWGGASQALTALRAPRWMEHYGKPADLAHLMQQWVYAILREGRFLQQMDPMTAGQFTEDAADYSPAALVLVDFTWRLAGVRQAGDRLEWNIRPPEAGVESRFELRVNPTLTARLEYTAAGARISINGKPVLQTAGVVRLITDFRGGLKNAAGIHSAPAKVSVEHVTGAKQWFAVKPNETIPLGAS